MCSCVAVGCLSIANSCTCDDSEAGTHLECVPAATPCCLSQVPGTVDCTCGDPCEQDQVEVPECSVAALQCAAGTRVEKCTMP